MQQKPPGPLDNIKRRKTQEVAGEEAEEGGTEGNTVILF